MNIAIPQLAKNYLVESLNKHSTSNVHEEFLMELGMNPGIAIDSYNKTKSPKSKNGIYRIFNIHINMFC